MSRSTLRCLSILLALVLLTPLTLQSGGLAAGRAASAAPAAPQTVTDLTAVADTTVKSAYPNTNFGSASPLQLAYGGVIDPYETRILMRFDLAGLPPGTVIDSAVMGLWQEDPAGGLGVSGSVSQASRAWGELSATWVDKPDPAPPAVSATLSATSEWKLWDLTSFAQSWLSTPAANYGVVIQGGSKSAFSRIFTSREGTNKPRLTVTYHIPFNCAYVTGISPAECNALVALYNSTNGSGWTSRAGWLDTLTPCSWYGVTCAGGHVTKLLLYTNQLSGAIPAQLDSLASLQELGLGVNQLSGAIPSQLGNLASLQQLSLHANQLSGAIPSQLGNLANLQYLYLWHNQLDGAIPAQLGNLTHLARLQLHDNRLTGAIPPQLGNLANLEMLTLGGNQLTGGIPPQLGNLAHLYELSLQQNQLDGAIPPELGNLANLGLLTLGANRLSGGIPTQLGNLTHLTGLYLYGNPLGGGIPTQLGNLTNLTDLSLSGNQLSGGIPPQLGNLSNLLELDLGSNQLSGTIPAQLGNLTNLHQLFLYNNQLSGAIPAQLGNLTKMWGLSLHSNQLSGAIPSQLCNPPYSTDQLSLDYNALTSGPACIDADDPNWAQTQTVPPTGLSVTLIPGPAAQLTWTPIPYTAHGGYYEVFYATTLGGPLTRHGATANKLATGYLAGSLSPGTTYYFKVRTVTPAHGDQQNALTSIWSAESAPVVVPSEDTPTPTATRTATPTSTASRTATATATPTATRTATATATPTATRTATATATPTATPTATATPTYGPGLSWPVYLPLLLR